MTTLLYTAAAVAAAVTSPSSPALGSQLSPVFSNTIVSTYPDGRVAHLWMNADGTYRATGRRGRPSSGHWSIRGDKVCLRQSTPFPGPFSYCTALRGGGVGTSWTAKAVTGEPIRVTVVRGR